MSESGPFRLESPAGVLGTGLMVLDQKAQTAALTFHIFDPERFAPSTGDLTLYAAGLRMVGHLTQWDRTGAGLTGEFQLTALPVADD